MALRDGNWDEVIRGEEEELKSFATKRIVLSFGKPEGGKMVGEVIRQRRIVRDVKEGKGMMVRMVNMVSPSIFRDWR